MRAPRKLTLGWGGKYVCENFELGLDDRGAERWCYMDLDGIQVFAREKDADHNVRIDIPMRWIRKVLKLLDSPKAKKMRKLAA